MDAGEDLVWLRPSATLAWVRRTQIAVATGLALLLDVGAPLLAGSPGTALVLGLITLALSLLALVISHRRIGAWGYAERAEDLLVRRGLLLRRLSVVPYGRMQFIDVTAGPFERAFGLATVRLHTAAAASDARIPGLAAPDAHRLRDALASRGEALSMGL